MAHPKIFKFKVYGDQVRLASKMSEASRLLARWSFGKEKRAWLHDIQASGYAITRLGVYITLLRDYSPRKMDIEFAEIINAQ